MEKAVETRDLLADFMANRLDNESLVQRWNTARNELTILESLASKQVPMKLVIHNINKINGNFDRYRCPSCNAIMTYDKKFDKFCTECGQKLDWD
jgi:NAD-dependent SIR2 family protein deacetylase